MHIKDANQLLDSFYLPFESGWKRLDTGVINIAVRTHMSSRFWLGEIDPPPNPKPTHEMLQKMVPDELGAGLFAHCCEEMSILAERGSQRQIRIDPYDGTTARQVSASKSCITVGYPPTNVPALYLATAMALQGMTKHELEALKLRIEAKRV